MALVEKIREAQRAQGTATILAVGTANPPNCVYQDGYPDFYFRVTNSEHMTDLKEKFKRICEKSKVKKRHVFLTEEILKKNPNMGKYGATSFNARQEMLLAEVPKLGKEAASKAIKEWNQPMSKITHLIFCTSSCIEAPGADYKLVKLLNLNPSVKRHMIYQQGCFAGGTALRLAKDLAENNVNARVLVVCCEITAMFFHGPCENHLDVLIGTAIFADGASSVIVGANPDTEIEHPLYQIVSTWQTIVPESEGTVSIQLCEMGASYYLKPAMVSLIGNNIESYMSEAFKDIGIKDWSSLFYIVHPGGVKIFEKIKESLGLEEDKLKASEHVMREYGNMGSPSVYFILDEMRKKSVDEGKTTTGDGFEWGVLVGLGPGITVETVVLRSVPIANNTQ